MGSKNNKNDDFMLGDILLPVMELMTLIIMALMDLATKGIMWGGNKALDKLFNREAPLIKIERDDLKVSKSTLKDDDLGYSITAKRSLKLSELNRKLHTAVIGASGSGKSALLDVLMFDDMMANKPIIFIDPKGDNGSLQNFINLCRIAKRDYLIFSEHYNGYGAAALNPVKDGSVTNIADRIHHSFTWTEEHYALLCYNALKDAIALLKTTLKTPITLRDIYNKLLDSTKGSEANPAAYDKKDIQGIITRISNVIDSDFGERLTGTDAYSVGQLRSSNKCIYVGLSVLGYAEIARSLGKIILGDLAYSVYDTYKKISVMGSHVSSPVGIYIDELSAVITNEFIEILNKCRGAKMEITFAFQSPSDIAKVDPHLAIQVLENASNWFVFKQRMEDGANMFASAIGTLPSRKFTKRVENGKELAQGSQRDVEELIAHHNVIKNLRTGQCVLLRHSPTRVDLVNVKYINPAVVEDNVRYLEFNKMIGPIPAVVQISTDTQEKAKTGNEKFTVEGGD
ncbi:MAG: hypothetical protein A2504_17005 [Bdellovibrionales bacterium RIFOXYD12_FULL_39_22]|nr:MAG: hypothetical protein A2385_17830 [Bdellovibrionales bacterium RIFOXYB1_FULL_39_21]OFZ44033.1 MAG: hypothetical protein A2485_14965 [Bdellovibrionales bacterium RIFOXYC12_FULL_39_17]OFZ48286.1 MAG: hypothetical protein A2404_08695 [Bdellovibrionales bacterium RIFOXYC1_FULL_39_130]OFZ76614.1 MAG: hypothetical protein A2560_17775 [Bdellovibrionales bacterium RIFOXYD1_FULL_39_84]OFZ76968.1 MAG: hypothetical protein A2451_11305 [Bdellovibrionales bacterium RIFOXYC2_FULL_39_8]OFZ95535.1 MAG: